MARRRRRDDYDDDDDDTPVSTPVRPKPRSDAYVGMMAITSLALLAAAVLLYLDFDALNSQAVQPPLVDVPPLGAVTG